MTNNDALNLVLTRDAEDRTLFVLDRPAVSRREHIATITGDVDDAIAWINTYLQMDIMWVQHATNPNVWVAIGLEE